ncbi:MAG: hypothetical protein COX20_07515 [Desulfobacterales bacterium CG23_combo_of_CG06-09_8_20_14_all_52_9]|nr:MAG: hypothetical protein COX20_07515 [Desulfobacterales bacterium CG23_combo_of_CG06-09_8_20_14_all_52_9]
MGNRGKRDHVRLKISRPVEFTVWGRRYEGRITDEGGGGAFIDARGRFKQGQEIKLSYLSPQGIHIEKSGMIVRVDENGIAVRFHHPGYAR